MNQFENISSIISTTEITQEIFDSISTKVSEEPSFLNYYNTLCENKWRVNAISDTELAKGFENFINFHVIDALCVLSAVKDWCGKRYIDIGSGAGLPALPIYIIMKEQLKQASLLEAKQKKTELLRIIAHELSLREIIIYCKRAEVAAHDQILREQYDIVTARAVGGIAYTLELTLPFLSVGGTALIYTGSISQDFIEFSTEFSSKLGGKLENIVNYLLKDAKNDRNIMVFRKIKQSEDIYPRKPNKLGK